MQKNNSTVKKQTKNVSRNALQIIIQELSLSDSKKVKMYEDLRCMGITDDNDPLIKFTMLQGLLAQYNGETAEKVVRERKNIEKTVEEIEDTVETIKDTVETIKELYKHFYNAILELRKRDIAELKDSIKLWKNEAIIGAQKMIVELRYEEECLRKQIKKQQEEFHKGKDEIYKAKKERDEIKNSCTNIALGTVIFVLFCILIGWGIISFIWTCEKNNKVEKYREAVESCKPTLKVTDSQSKWDRKYKQISEKIKKKKHEYESNLNVANSQSELDPKYKQLLEELDNESSQEKRLEILDKITNL